MTVSAILSTKGGEIISTTPDATLESAARTLADNKIGALIVLHDGGKVCGIVSERDIVRLVASGGASALGSPVDSCMTQKVVSCTSDESIDSVMEKMTKGKFRHVPVIDNGHLSGIISIGDVVKLKIQQAERDAEELKRYIAG